MMTGDRELVVEIGLAAVGLGIVGGLTSRDSAVDQWCRGWDVPNLLVCDGSVLPTKGSSNPALTISALAARTADWLLAHQPTPAGSFPEPADGTRRASGRTRLVLRPRRQLPFAGAPHRALSRCITHAGVPGQDWCNSHRESSCAPLAGCATASMRSGGSTM